mmetsp:Transcript_2543/g.7912  ORF Transcript_2543/g.7912 Transcript_2543/m.7912 type:complete len:122 (-) Transcript_2543:440-805(-)
MGHRIRSPTDHDAVRVFDRVEDSPQAGVGRGPGYIEEEDVGVWSAVSPVVVHAWNAELLSEEPNHSVDDLLIVPLYIHGARDLGWMVGPLEAVDDDIDVDPKDKLIVRQQRPHPVVEEGAH